LEKTKFNCIKKMNITHTWIIKKLVQKDDGTGTVTEVAYKVVSRDTETGKAVSNYKTCELNTNNINLITFIPYNELTEEQVIQFVKDKLGDEVQEIESLNAREIRNKINPQAPSVITENLPWS